MANLEGVKCSQDGKPDCEALSHAASWQVALRVHVLAYSIFMIERWAIRPLQRWILAELTGCTA